MAPRASSVAASVTTIATTITSHIARVCVGGSNRIELLQPRQLSFNPHGSRVCSRSFQLFSIHFLNGTTLRLSTTLSGIAGEYFVCGELSRRGYVASLTLRNTRGIDILASNADATRSVGIQVKSKQGHKPDWMVNQKVEMVDLAENLVFVFVALNEL